MQHVQCQMLSFINVFGLTIPMYGLMMAVGFIGGSCIAYIRARHIGLIGENLIIILACALGCAILGGGLLYVLVTYTPDQIIALIKAGNWNALTGIVFYGALIGGTLGALLGSVIARDDIRNYLDVVVPIVPLGHAFGRIGCFCAGCCYGRPTDSVIGVIYTQAVGGAPPGIRLLPVQLFEAGADIIIFLILISVSAKTKSRYLTTCLYCILYGIARFVLEFYRYDSIRGMAAGLFTSQWISIVLVAGGAIGLVMICIKSSEQRMHR